MFRPLLRQRFVPRGFTLIELLVVVAIIVLLVAIMLPSLSAARDQGYRARCAANLRAQAQALHMYLTENENNMPFPNWDQLDGQYKAAGWLYKAPYDLSLNPKEKNVETGSFWPYLKSYGIYRCPKDYPPFTHGPTQYMTSYIMNGAAIGYNMNRMPWARGSAFRPDCIMIWEMDELGSSSTAWNDGSTKPSSGATRRHGNGLTVSRIDGGAEWITRKQYADEEARRPGRLWCNPYSSDGR